jgi:serine/threonine protein kinase
MSIAYTIVDDQFYETLNRYRPSDDEFLEIASGSLPHGWTRSQETIWHQWEPRGAILPREGWKVHLSATLDHASHILTRACEVFAATNVPFKHAIDRWTLALQSNKNWPSPAAGKFITAYPPDADRCRELLECLHAATSSYSGPYILSDRRVRGSKVVHYRYGVSRPMMRLNIRGERVSADDERPLRFVLPEGVTDPMPYDREAEAALNAETLKRGKYVIESLLAFSGAGGVYLGRDTGTGEAVVIKEARAHAGESLDGSDATARLEREHRLLEVMRDTGIAPRPIDLFREWEHTYLVEEYVEGASLGDYHAHWSLSRRCHPSLAERNACVSRLCRVHAAIARALQTLHDRGVVFGDLAPSNVLVTEDGARVVLIDFEGAFEVGRDASPSVFTPGFVPHHLAGRQSDTATDCFGLGALLLAALLPINEILTLDERAFEPLLLSSVRDLGIPREVTDCIRELLLPERSERIDLQRVIHSLTAARNASTSDSASEEADDGRLEDLIEGILSYINSVSDPRRADRLFPAAPSVFQTNPLSLAFGACGVAYVLSRIAGAVPQPFCDWILRRPIAADAYPPGLYVGMAGVSWALLEIGLPDRAEETLRLTFDHPLLQACPDLFYGIAGWGMAQLRFFLATSDELYLRKAIEAGSLLLDTCCREGSQCWWNVDGIESCGLAHGSAGISLFLLYLYRATRDERYLAAGQGAMDRVIAKAVIDPERGMTWRVHEEQAAVTNSWRYGNAGIGIVLLRYRTVLNESRYAEVVRELSRDCERKFSTSCGLLYGLAGLGEFHLDRAEFEGDSGAPVAAARRALAGILLLKLKKRTGIAFPGPTCARISCDFATGSAGIALFIHRLAKRTGAAFMLDALLPG